MKEILDILTKLEMNNYLCEKGIISIKLYERVKNNLLCALTPLLSQDTIKQNEVI